MSLANGALHRILVVAPQQLGDVLLATPLIHSLRLAWPRAHIAALVFDDTVAPPAGMWIRFCQSHGDQRMANSAIITPSLAQK